MFCKLTVDLFDLDLRRTPPSLRKGVADIMLLLLALLLGTPGAGLASCSTARAAFVTGADEVGGALTFLHGVVPSPARCGEV